jgi:hypothetical protein
MTKKLATLNLKNGGKVFVYHNTYSSLLGFTEFNDRVPGRSDMKRYPQVTDEIESDYVDEVKSIFEKEIIEIS